MATLHEDNSAALPAVAETLESCLVELDRLKAGIAAAHLSFAIDRLREHQCLIGIAGISGSFDQTAGALGGVHAAGKQEQGASGTPE